MVIFFNIKFIEIDISVSIKFVGSYNFHYVIPLCSVTSNWRSLWSDFSRRREGLIGVAYNRRTKGEEIKLFAT